MSQLKAVLFDLDGTLIDSEYFHYQCWVDILKEFSYSMTYEEWVEKYAGIPLPENCATIKERYQLDISLPDLMEWRERQSITGFSTKDIELMPFVLETIQFYKSKGLKLAVVTASPRADVEAIFKRNGLSHYFDLMITRTEVSVSKPDPECYLLCCDQLGIAKDECIVFEDTLNGLKAAKAAGLTCYVIQQDQSQHLKLNMADKIFLDLRAAKDDVILNLIAE
jgi:beta-phosphoglucomutase